MDTGMRCESPAAIPDFQSLQAVGESMSKLADTCSPVKGEVAGAFLLGLDESFRNLQPYLASDMTLPSGTIAPDAWYPHSMLIDLLHNIELSVPKAKNLFFQAGVNFLRIWYEKGPGNRMIRSGLDWIYANKGGGGYNSVVRGGDKDEIGWCELVSIDEQAGVAVYENVMPLAPEYVRGVFYGGCILFGDMEYVDVAVSSEPYAKNLKFHRTMVTVHFRLMTGDNDDLDAKVDGLRQGDSLELTPVEVEHLLWRYKSLRVRARLDSAYHADLSDLLIRSVETTQAQRDEVTHLSNHDPLTGLANVRLARDRMQWACAHANREMRRMALLYIDLDGFKGVNDTMGHDAGDLVLKTVADRLNGCIRATDTAARLGGDEFLVILNDLKEADTSVRIAESILAIIGQPIPYGTDLVHISASIGIALYPDHARPTDELLACADRAMYASKKSGKNRLSLCSQEGI